MTTRIISGVVIGVLAVVVTVHGGLIYFLLWQCAYSELYFSDRLWPDFDEAALDEALADYAGRQRRFGGRRAAGEQDAS